MRSAPALRRGLIALSLPMRRYEKATRADALKFQISDYDGRMLGMAIGLLLTALNVPRAGRKAHVLGPRFSI